MFLMHDMHGYSNLIFGCVAKHSAVRGVRIRLLIEFMVCFSLLRCDLQEKYYYLGLMVLVVSSTKLVSRKSSFVVTIVYDVSWRVPTREPISNPIRWNAY